MEGYACSPVLSSKRKNEEDLDTLKTKRVSVSTSVLDKLAINSIRCVSADLPQIANSGHPGAPIGCAPMAHALYGNCMKFSPKHPDWINRDRFVLSNGHACALQYVMLYLSGYNLTLNDLKHFRALNSKTPGHPECHITSGVEVCTGPLGQGISNAVGMAIASKHLAAKFNKSNFTLFDNFIFVICGDGCLQEGVSSEACSLAGHLGLGNLILLYDDNSITIDGSTELSFTENVMERYKAYNWHVQCITDGNDGYADIVDAIQNAKNCVDKPSIIRIKTKIAYGSLNEGSEKTHGAPLGIDDIKQMKSKFGFDPNQTFHFPDEVLDFYRKKCEEGDNKYNEWMSLFNDYKQQYKNEYEDLNRRLQRKLPENLLSVFPQYNKDSKSEATRAYSGRTLLALADVLPEMIGGSADLTGSNSSALKGEKDFQKNAYENRYIRYGVREHAMAAISNGIYSYGCLLPFCATFLNFITYGWGAVRLTALSRFGVLFIATHDSIELGEDGPTHQPIETLALIRATPNIFAVRPADGNETNGGYMAWLMNRETPVVLCLCRSAVPNLQNSSMDKTFTYGGYVLQDFNNNTLNNNKKIIIGSSGSELHICVDAKDMLEKDGYDVKIVSLPCWKIFDMQTDEYKQSVLNIKERKTGNICTVYVEASSPFGWEKYFDYKIGMTTFGASASRTECWKHFGFTKENIYQKVIHFASIK